MRITPENCITIAVDYQTRLVPSMAHERELIHNSRILLQGLRVLDDPGSRLPAIHEGPGRNRSRDQGAGGRLPRF